TVAQFSFWGNYLPRVYPTYLRGTGESFAANVGGRAFGTGANFLTTRIAILILAAQPTLARPSGIAYAACAVVLFVYLLGTILTFFVPDPREGMIEDGRAEHAHRVHHRRRRGHHLRVVPARQHPGDRPPRPGTRRTARPHLHTHPDRRDRRQRETCLLRRH